MDIMFLRFLIYLILLIAVIDYIYHEHLSYHSIKALVPFLRKQNLYIYDVIKVTTKGGSIRVVCGKKKQRK